MLSRMRIFNQKNSQAKEFPNFQLDYVIYERSLNEGVGLELHDQKADCISQKCRSLMLSSNYDNQILHDFNL